MDLFGDNSTTPKVTRMSIDVMLVRKYGECERDCERKTEVKRLGTRVGW